MLYPLILMIYDDMKIILKMTMKIAYGDGQSHEAETMKRDRDSIHEDCNHRVYDCVMKMRPWWSGVRWDEIRWDEMRWDENHEMDMTKYQRKLEKMVKLDEDNEH